MIESSVAKEFQPEIMNNIFIRQILLTFVFSWIFFSVYALEQELSLEQCVKIAEENNLSLKNQYLNIESSKIAEKVAKNQMIPSLNASTSYGYNFGFVVDPTTNSFANQTSSILNGGLNAQVELFQFGRIRQEQRISGLNVMASESDWKQEKRNISLSVANAYLQTVLQKELVANAERNKSLSEEQVSRMEKMLKAGTIAEAELLNIRAQWARDGQSVVNAQNSYQSSLLQLRLLMRYDQEFEPLVPSVEQIALDDPYRAAKLESILSSARNNDFRIRAAELREQVSEQQISANQKSLMPSLSLFGNVNTRYSSLAKRTNGVRTEEVSTDFSINGQEVTAVQEVQFFNFEDAPVGYQLQNNLGQALGVSLNIPIFNQYRLQSNVDEAKINRERSVLNTETVEQQLESEVNEAYQNYNNAVSSMEAADLTYEAMQLAFDNAQTAFEHGAINNFEYSQSRIQRDNALSDQIRAKYNYIFAIKVLDYYMGINLYDE